MDKYDFMRLAITMAEKCNPAKPKETPRVGAVVVIDDKVIALASRGNADHAEKIALDDAARIGANLTQATVYTTLEPCVGGVRRQKKDSCADRLADAKVKKVVVGIHDPNIAVCGKGFLRLQEAGIETELFPHDLAERIKAINKEFILAQQRIGARITCPGNKAKIPTEPGGFITLKGKWTNPPAEGEHVYAVVKWGDLWWPQFELQPVPGVDGKWQVRINIGSTGDHIIVVGKLNHLGKVLFDYYFKVIETHEQWRDKVCAESHDPDYELPGPHWIGIQVEGSEPPKGIDPEDSILINITEIIPSPEPPPPPASSAAAAPPGDAAPPSDAAVIGPDKSKGEKS